MIGGKDMFKKFRDVVNRTFQTVNHQNSMMGVQCVVPDKCGFRFTTACDNCKNNVGAHKNKIFYEPK